MGKINFVLTKILFWPIYAIVAILVSSFSFKPGEVYHGYTNGAFYLIASVGLILSIIYWVLEHKKNKVIAHPVYFPLILFLLTMSIAIVWIQQNQTFVNPDTDFTVTAVISNEFRVKCTIILVLFFNAIYMLIFVVSRRTFRLQQIFWFLRLYVLFTVIAIAYSLIKEFDQIKLIFSGEPLVSYSIQSFFYNENFFACVILFGLIAMMILNFYKSRPYNYIVMFALYFYMILTTCTTTLFVGTLCFIFYILLDIISLFKKHWVVATISLSIFFVIFAGLAVSVYFMYENEVEWVKSFFKFMELRIFSKDFQTFSGRTEVWKTIWDNLIANDPINMLFGRGYGTSLIMIRNLFFCMENGNPNGVLSSAHNGLIEIAYTNGLVGLSLYGLLIVLVLIAFVLLLVKKKVKFALMYLFIILTVLGYSLFESHFFFGQGMFNMVITVFAILPLFNAVRALYKPKIAKPIKEGDYHFVKMNYLKLKSFMSMMILPFFIPSTLIIIESSLNGGPHGMIMSHLKVLLIVLVLLMFVPQIVSLFYKDATRRRFIFRCIFYSVIFVGLFFLTPWLGQILSRHVPFFKHLELFTFTVLGVYLFTLWLVFTLVKKEKLSNYFKYTFLEPILGAKIAFPISIALGCVGVILFKAVNLVSPLTTFTITIVSFIVYYLLLTLLPSIRNYYYINFLNERCLYNLKKSCQKYEI